jgi:hypothetical protein
VSGSSLVVVCIIPGNVLTPSSWRVVQFVDERGFIGWPDGRFS